MDFVPSLYKPSELKKLLDSLCTKAKRSLSQNFLIDRHVLEKIMDLAQIAAGDQVLEVGPGPGALTEMLLSKKATVIAIEKDTIFAEHLKTLEPWGLQIHCQDVLKADFEILMSNRGKLVANLPYHLTTPIFEKVVQFRHLFSRIVVMVQEEVARRIVSLPGSKDYSSLSLFLQFYYRVHYGAFVSRRSFSPAPKVDSALLVLEPKEELPAVEEEQFFKMTRTAFGQRRKMLRTSLAKLYQPQIIQEALMAASLNPLARPEELGVEQFVTLFSLLKEREKTV